MQAVDTSTPSLARAYDHMLGGRASFVADRALASRLQALYPALPEVLSEARTYTTRAVTLLAGRWVRQFVDIGSGLPTRPSVHEAALAVARSSRVVYADREPGVVSHAAALVPAGVRVIEGDIAEPEALLWSLAPLVDLDRPVCLVLSLILQVLDAGTARAVTGVLVKALAPGSHVIITCGTGEAGRMPDMAGGADLAPADVESFLAGLDPLPLDFAEPGPGKPGPGKPGPGKPGLEKLGGGLVVGCIGRKQ